jgi:hypothetical protein
MRFSDVRAESRYLRVQTHSGTGGEETDPVADAHAVEELLVLVRLLPIPVTNLAFSTLRLFQRLI